jgi:multicomponent Na+:H+ antiporter subunit A
LPVVTILLVHALVAGIAPALERWRRQVFLFTLLAPVSALGWLALRWSDVVAGRAPTETIVWVPGIGLSLQLRLDGFALLMVLLIAGIGALVMIYARSYFGPDKTGLARFAGTLTAFGGAMIGAVVSDHLIAIYVFWELTSVTSYLLIGFDDRNASARAAALQALLITAGGGLAMLAGFVLLGQGAGTYQLSTIVASPPTGPTTAVAAALVLAGAFTKSAQVPTHFWLPGAMAAPTPVSAYLHSATMVKLGVYLIARLAPAMAPEVDFWVPVVVGVGIATMFHGGYAALRQHDLKLLLAYGTVSQLGMMVALVGAGDPELTFAGVAVILGHALFKATLFLVAGIVDHSTGTRDIRRLQGVAGRLKLTAVMGIVGIASMAGIPPLFGFISKEAAIEAELHAPGSVARLALVGIVIGSVLTFAYGARFVYGAFVGRPTRDELPDVHRPSALFVAPAAVLTVFTVLFGPFVLPADALVNAAATALDPGAGEYHLALWHGFGPPLLISTVIVVVGFGLFAARERVEAWQRRVDRMPTATSLYRRGLTGTISLADRVTGVVQNGSLPVYLATILLTVVVLPGAVLVPTLAVPDGLPLAYSPFQVAAAGAVVLIAIATAVTRRRLAAVILLGGVGYGMAVLFVLQGAPDLALTQFLVETVTLIVFVLVLRHLPPRFERVPWRFGRGVRIVLAVVTGVFVSAFTLAATSARTATPISEEQIALALPEAGGKNVVNVILTDFRALDTLGEITVLVVAALGITSLVAVGRRERRARQAPGEEDGE